MAPYLAGLYALACQVKPDVTPDLFWEKAVKTGTPLDYSKLPPVSRERVRRKQADRLDARLAEARSGDDAEEARRGVMETYRSVSGEPAPKVSDAQFRDWAVDWLTDEEMGRREGREGRIVKPQALMEALWE